MALKCMHILPWVFEAGLEEETRERTLTFNLFTFTYLLTERGLCYYFQYGTLQHILYADFNIKKMQYIWTCCTWTFIIQQIQVVFHSNSLVNVCTGAVSATAMAQFEPEIKPWSLHITIRSKVFIFSHNEQPGWGSSLLVHLSSRCVRPADLLFTIKPPIWCTYTRGRGSIYTSALCSQMSAAKWAWRARCSDAETGATNGPSCSLPGNYHIKLTCPLVLTGPGPHHYRRVQTGMTLLDYD